MLGFLSCVWLSFALWIDKYACLGIKDAMLYVRCMIRVYVGLEYSAELVFNKVKIKTQ